MPSSFPETRWSLLARLQGPPSAESTQALEEICVAYWYPLYAFARRTGLNHEDAKDNVQDLFARLISSNGLALVDAERGRLRSFFITVLKNQIATNWVRDNAQKRGGQHQISSLDMTDAEGRYLLESVSVGTSPERLYERKWALELLSAARAELQASYSASDQLALFRMLSPALDESAGWAGSSDIAKQLGMKETTLRVKLHRLRTSYREILLRHVRATVENEADVKVEAAYLMQLFADD